MKKSAKKKKKYTVKSVTEIVKYYKAGGFFVDLPRLVVHPVFS